MAGEAYLGPLPSYTGFPLKKGLVCQQPQKQMFINHWSRLFPKCHHLKFLWRGFSWCPSSSTVWILSLWLWVKGPFGEGSPVKARKLPFWTPGGDEGTRASVTLGVALCPKRRLHKFSRYVHFRKTYTVVSACFHENHWAQIQ